MAVFSFGVLSGSTNGLPIRVAATAIGSGTVVHTADATAIDSLEIYVTNTHTAEVALTIGWGGTTDPNHLIVDAYVVPVNAKGIKVVPRGNAITGGAVVYAAAGTTNVLNLTGSYIRYTP